jgi:hypothetical protein
VEFVLKLVKILAKLAQVEFVRIVTLDTLFQITYVKLALQVAQNVQVTLHAQDVVQDISLLILHVLYHVLKIVKLVTLLENALNA